MSVVLEKVFNGLELNYLFMTVKKEVESVNTGNYQYRFVLKARRKRRRRISIWGENTVHKIYIDLDKLHRSCEDMGIRKKKYLVL